MGLNADAILRDCLKISGLYVEDRDELVKCFVLRMAEASPHFDPQNPDHVANAERIVNAAIARQAPRLAKPAKRPTRVRWPRPGRPKKPRESGCMSCGTKKACRNHTITAAELIEWASKACKTGERTKKAGAAVGGTLADARRAAGLWDWDHPIDQQRNAWDGPVDPRAMEAVAAARNEAAARGETPPANPFDFVTTRASNYGGPGAFGITCQAEGSTVQCFHNQTGVNRSWSVTGRRFTPQELARFSQVQCSPHCGQTSISEGAPPDAKTVARRVGPRNFGPARKLDCRTSPPPPLIPPTVLQPLAPLGNQPDAELPRPACVPDTIIGVDGGMFGSGWYSVIRRGQRLLVPNPELCGGAPPQF